MKKDKNLLTACIIAFLINTALFFIKLYIGLSTSSISIYSDAVNNLFDSLSGGLTFVCLSVLYRASDLSMEYSVKKTEQLLSFIISVIVTGTGFYFAYSSLERLMYPAPLWYTPLYLFTIIGTAAVKMGLFFFFRVFYRKTKSPVIRVMSYDSLLDFFITAVTAFSLYISGNGNFAFDAVGGLVISAVIIVSAVKLLISGALSLVDYVKAEKRETIRDIFSSRGIKIERIIYRSSEDGAEAYVEADFPSEDERLGAAEECEEKTGIKISFICKN